MEYVYDCPVEGCKCSFVFADYYKFECWKKYGFCPRCAHKKLRQYLKLEEIVKEWTYHADNEKAMEEISAVVCDITDNLMRSGDPHPKRAYTRNAAHNSQQPDLLPQEQHEAEGALAMRDRLGL